VERMNRKNSVEEAVGKLHRNKIEVLTETEITKKVISKCLFKEINLDNGFSFDECERCIFHEKENCSWIEYPTVLVSKRQIRNDGEYGPTDPNIFQRIIKCACCGKQGGEVELISYSDSLYKGASGKCKRCGTLHAFLRSEARGEEIIKIFAIPLVQWPKQTIIQDYK